MTEAEQERTLWFGMAKQIAHQMGTPLSAIMGWLELLPTAKDPIQVAAEINQNLDRLKYLLERLNQIGPPTRFETFSFALAGQNLKFCLAGIWATSPELLPEPMRKQHFKLVMPRYCPSHNF